MGYTASQNLARTTTLSLFGTERKFGTRDTLQQACGDVRKMQGFAEYFPVSILKPKSDGAVEIVPRRCMAGSLGL